MTFLGSLAVLAGAKAIELYRAYRRGKQAPRPVQPPAPRPEPVQLEPKEDWGVPSGFPHHSPAREPCKINGVAGWAFTVVILSTVFGGLMDERFWLGTLIVLMIGLLAFCADN